MNVVPQRRSGSVARALVDAVDQWCRDGGVDEWEGEINAVSGTRRRAIERVVGQVVSGRYNHTFSWFVGDKVMRYTVRRTVAVD